MASSACAVRVLTASLVAAASLTGCTTGFGSHPSQAEREATLLTFNTPGDGWTLTGANIGDAFNHDPPDDPQPLRHGLWSNGDADAIQYLARVTPQNRDRVCAQAIDWVNMGLHNFPRHPTGQDRTRMAAACERAINAASEGHAGSNLIGGVGVKSQGYSYDSFTTVRTQGVTTNVEVTALIRPQR